MMMNKLLKLVTTFAITLGVFGGCAYAADSVYEPSAHFTLEIKALTMYSGETATLMSKGMVTFKGKEYPFTVQALTMGNNFGASTFKANGVLYGMKEISEFESPFFVIGGGIHPQEGNQVVTFKNNNGVVAVIDGTLNGPLWAPATGAVVKLLNK